MVLYLILWITVFGPCNTDGLTHCEYEVSAEQRAEQSIEFTMDKKAAETHLIEGHDVYRISLLFQRQPGQRRWKIQKMKRKATYNIVGGKPQFLDEEK